MEITGHKNAIPCEAYETLCGNCQQLRLSFVVSNTCGHCGSANIVKGKVDELKKDAFLMCIDMQHHVQRGEKECNGSCQNVVYDKTDL